MFVYQELENGRRKSLASLLLLLPLLLLAAKNARGMGVCNGKFRANDILIETFPPGHYLSEQGVDTTRTPEVEEALREGDVMLSTDAALYLACKNRKEAIPMILQRVEALESYDIIRFKYLTALELLQYEKLVAVARSFANRAYVTLERDPLAESAYQQSVKMLFEHGSYKQLDRVLDFIHEYSNSADGDRDYLYLLGKLIDNGDFKSRVVDTLIYVLQHYKNVESRRTAVYMALKLPDEIRLARALQQTAVRDSSPKVRSDAILMLRRTYPDEPIIDILLKNLRETRDPEFINDLIRRLVYVLSPRSLAELKRLKDSGRDSVRKAAADKFENYWWLYFEPYGRAFDYEASRNLDSLAAYGEDIYDYEWLGGSSFFADLRAKLQRAGGFLARGDSAGASEKIGSYRRLLKNVYEANSSDGTSPPFITREGFKFLNKNAGYLQEQLNK